MRNILKQKLASKIGVNLPQDYGHKPLKLRDDEILLEGPHYDEVGNRYWYSVSIDDMMKALFGDLAPVYSNTNPPPTPDNLRKILRDADFDGSKGYRKYIEQWISEGLI